MTGGTDVGDLVGLRPEEAFAVLGDETRLGILRALGEAGEPIAFSELYDRLAIDDSGQFSYHLDQLVDHFVRKHEGVYELTQAGRRVVMAVLAGTVTAEAVVERTRVDDPYHLCGTRMAVSYQDGQVGMYCPSCGGQYAGQSGGEARAEDTLPPRKRQRVGTLELPPAGVEGRDPGALLDAAYTWCYNRILAVVATERQLPADE